MPWRSFWDNPAWRLLAFTLVGVLGFVLAVAIYVRWDLGDIRTLLELGNEQKPLVLLLLLMVGAEGLLSAIGALLLLSWYRFVFSRPRPGLRDLAVGWFVPALLLGFVALGFSLLVLSNGLWPPPELGGIEISSILSTQVIVVAFLSVAGLFAIAVRVRTDLNGADLRDDAERKPLSARIDAYLRLKRYQDRFLALAAVSFTATALSAFLIIHAFNAGADGSAGGGSDRFSFAYAFAHGGLFTLGMGVAFFIARQPILSVGEAMLKDLVGAPPGEIGSISEWLEQRKQARTLLELRAYSLPGVAEALAIMAPLLGALLTALLGRD